MPVRLPKGIDNAWQSTMASAANLAVEAGRAAGQGWASLGAGIGQGLAGFAGARQQQQARSDRLAQQGIDNAMQERQLALSELRGKYGIVDDLWKQANEEAARTALIADQTKDPAMAAAADAAAKRLKSLEATRMSLGTQVLDFHAKSASAGGCSGGRCAAPSYSAPAATAPMSAPAPEPSVQDWVGERGGGFDLGGYETSAVDTSAPEVRVATAETALSELQRAAKAARSPRERVGIEKRVREETIRLATANRELAERKRAQELADYKARVAASAEVGAQAGAAEEAKKREDAMKLVPGRVKVLREMGVKGTIPEDDPVIVEDMLKKALQGGKEKDVATFKNTLSDEDKRVDREFKERMLVLSKQMGHENAVKRIELSWERRDAAEAAARAARTNDRRFDELKVLHDDAAGKWKALLDQAEFAPREVQKRLWDEASKYLELANRYSTDMLMRATPAASAPAPAAAPAAAPVAPPAPAPTADRESAAKRMDAWLAANPGATDEQKRAAWAAIKAGR